MTYNRHYCYRIDFADGFVYFGVRTCQCTIAADSYMGTPTTHKAKWQTDIPRVKTIVSVHATRQLANEAEAKLISDFWAVSGKELSLNAAVCGAKFNMQGVKHTAETKAKLSEAQQGKRHTAETKAKMSEARQGKPGKPHTAETKAKLSDAGKGKLLTTETKAKLSEAQQGKRHTAETKAKMSEARQCKRHTAETKAKIGKASTGTRWYTDGFTSIKLKQDAEIPEGFKPGRAKRL